MIPNNNLRTDNNGWPTKTLCNYVSGFVLCLIFTILSFAIVKYTFLDKNILYILLSVFAVIQMLVQAGFFLGLKTGKEGKWNLLPFLFTILIIIFLIGGTLWIMYNLSALMIDSYLYR